ncbi:MAG: replication-associated recombination protein A [Deltaproteobacteria bacterium]|nr:replication-associated recombination protein A [Deltaproteobacteria bacterium]
MDLFEQAADRAGAGFPLAERMRPERLDDVVGQRTLLAPGTLFRSAVERDEIASMILWGPPGSGKTTLASVIARTTGSTFIPLSAVSAGVKEIREEVEAARTRRAAYRKRTILFLDEIHRLNKAQQDALLPHVERGTVTLIGATTENPSFEVNAALLSRTMVFVLAALAADDLETLIRRALVDATHGIGAFNQSITDDAARAIAAGADGDARRALSALDAAAAFGRTAARSTIEIADVEAALQKRVLLYDRAGEEHYNVVSAFIKSLRGSDPDAALYWMARMLEAGEAPRFILRRMVIFASEDVGNADPRALMITVAALHAFELVGLPEGRLAMTQAATYLALAPKSNAVITAYDAARAVVRDRGALPVPAKLRNAPTKLMRELAYGHGYQYPHDHEGAYVPETYLPDEIADEIFYKPRNSGFERDLAIRLAELKRLRDTGPNK